MKIKYFVAVAAVLVATAFCGCGNKGEEEVIQLQSVDEGDNTTQKYTDESKITESTSSNGQEKESPMVTVYVCGAVKNPDVYTLFESCRMIDAVDAAGGFENDAGYEYLNLAEKITDGQKIYIPTAKEVEDALSSGLDLYGSVVNITTNSPGITTADGRGSADNSGGTNGTNASGLVDINSADKATLMTLPGIGESKADKIIAYREENGRFSSIEDIMLVGGIKEGLFNKVKDRICAK